MSRAVLAPFEAYQKARVTFVQTVAELAQRPQNIEALQSAGMYRKSKFNINGGPLLLNFQKKAVLLTVVAFRCYGFVETTPFG